MRPATVMPRAVFALTLRRVEIDVLSRLSRAHYDLRCKLASQPGGFIYGWGNHLDLMENEPNSRVTATWNDLDTCLKILEVRVALTGESRVCAEKLAEEIRHILSVARRATLVTWEAIEC